MPEIPRVTYHATLTADAILKEGFKTKFDTGHMTFGSHHTVPYVSTTNKENALRYARGLHKLIYFLTRPSVAAKQRAVEKILVWAEKKGCKKNFRFYLLQDEEHYPKELGGPGQLGFRRRIYKKERPEFSAAQVEDYLVIAEIFKMWDYSCGGQLDFPVIVGKTEEIMKMKRFRPSDVSVVKAEVDYKRVILTEYAARQSGITFDKEAIEHLKTDHAAYYRPEREWQWYDQTLLHPVGKITVNPWT